eukprot:CAMPEP_0203807038 /NCGR_PEP_ID=MMETSP0115-20131106/839_1 /ASSEMBLY_ACC=CAM_ASM_000227 /TAXON_ID=33651 /ORGANISM="Bicosoecid sp, Strain ms1" /LENGTH=2508 /DNA_ID=CAMNT_0050715707 /DNA_START=176 /DNA_END=7698 /DNA_ORIENTATION=-
MAQPAGDAPGSDAGRKPTRIGSRGSVSDAADELETTSRASSAGRRRGSQHSLSGGSEAASRTSSVSRETPDGADAGAAAGETGHRRSSSRNRGGVRRGSGDKRRPAAAGSGEGDRDGGGGGGSAANRGTRGGQRSSAGEDPDARKAAREASGGSGAGDAVGSTPASSHRDSGSRSGSARRRGGARGGGGGAGAGRGERPKHAAGGSSMATSASTGSLGGSAASSASDGHGGADASHELTAVSDEGAAADGSDDAGEGSASFGSGKGAFRESGRRGNDRPPRSREGASSAQRSRTGSASLAGRRSTQGRLGGRAREPGTPLSEAGLAMDTGFDPDVRAVRLKCYHKSEIRAVAVAEGDSFRSLSARLANDYGFPVSLKYEDSDGDLVTLSSQNDLNELLTNEVGRRYVAVHVSEAPAPPPPSTPVDVSRVLASPTPTAAVVVLNPLEELPTVPEAPRGTSGDSVAVAAVAGRPAERPGRLDPIGRPTAVRDEAAAASAGGGDDTEGSAESKEAPSGARGVASDGTPLSIAAPVVAKAAVASSTASSFSVPPATPIIGAVVPPASPGAPALAAGAISDGAAATDVTGEGGGVAGAPPRARGGAGTGALGRLPDRRVPSAGLRRPHSGLRTPSTPGRGRMASTPSTPAASRKIRWQRGEVLGAGAYGTVYLGLNLDSGELMAVKQLDTSEVSAKELLALEHEVSMMDRFDHENIVRYLGTEHTEETLSIFLEYVPGGSIRSLVNRFGKLDEAVVRVYTRQLLLGLEYLHRHGIAHRDIKGANVLVANDGTIKLADFGASKQLGHKSVTANTGLKGTPLWMAPEVIKEQQSARGWKKADIWSVGCTVIEMATGKPPWSHFSNPVTAMYHIACADELPEMPATLSSAGHDFLALCFRREPSERPDVTLLLLHPFVTSMSSSHVQHLAQGMFPVRPSTAGDDGGMRGYTAGSMRDVSSRRMEQRPSLESAALKAAVASIADVTPISSPKAADSAAATPPRGPSALGSAASSSPPEASPESSPPPSGDEPGGAPTAQAPAPAPVAAPVASPAEATVSPALPRSSGRPAGAAGTDGAADTEMEAIMKRWENVDVLETMEITRRGSIASVLDEARADAKATTSEAADPSRKGATRGVRGGTELDEGAAATAVAVAHASAATPIVVTSPDPPTTIASPPPPRQVAAAPSPGTSPQDARGPASPGPRYGRHIAEAAPVERTAASAPSQTRVARRHKKKAAAEGKGSEAEAPSDEAAPAGSRSAGRTASSARHQRGGGRADARQRAAVASAGVRRKTAAGAGDDDRSHTADSGARDSRHSAAATIGRDPPPAPAAKLSVQVRNLAGGESTESPGSGRSGSGSERRSNLVSSPISVPRAPTSDPQDEAFEFSLPARAAPADADSEDKTSSKRRARGGAGGGRQTEFDVDSPSSAPPRRRSPRPQRVRNPGESGGGGKRNRGARVLSAAVASSSEDADDGPSMALSLSVSPLKTKASPDRPASTTVMEAEQAQQRPRSKPQLRVSASDTDLADPSSFPALASPISASPEERRARHPPDLAIGEGAKSASGARGIRGGRPADVGRVGMGRGRVPRRAVPLHDKSGRNPRVGLRRRTGGARLRADGAARRPKGLELNLAVVGEAEPPMASPTSTTAAAAAKAAAERVAMQRANASELLSGAEASASASSAGSDIEDSVGEVLHPDGHRDSSYSDDGIVGEDDYTDDFHYELPHERGMLGVPDEVEEDGGGDGWGAFADHISEVGTETERGSVLESMHDIGSVVSSGLGALGVRGGGASGRISLTSMHELHSHRGAIVCSVMGQLGASAPLGLPSYDEVMAGADGVGVGTQVQALVFATGGADGTVRVCSAMAGASLATLPHSRAPPATKSSPMRQRGLSRGGAGGAAPGDTAGAGRGRSTAHTPSAADMADLMVSGGGSSAAKLRAMARHAEEGLSAEEAAARIAAASPDRVVAPASASTTPERAAPAPTAATVTAVCLLRTSNLLVSGTDDGYLWLWDIASGKKLRRMRGHSEAVTCMVTHTDVVAGTPASPDRRPTSSGIAAAAARAKGRSRKSKLTALTGVLVITGSADQTIRVWALGERRALLHTLRGHTGSINTVVVVPNSWYVASASSDQTVRVWDLRTGRLKMEMHDHFGSVQCVLPVPAVSTLRDGAAVAVASSGLQTLAGRPIALLSGARDGSIKLWDGRGDCSRTLRGHRGAVTVMRLAPALTGAAGALASDISMHGSSAAGDTVSMAPSVSRPGSRALPAGGGAGMGGGVAMVTGSVSVVDDDDPAEELNTTYGSRGSHGSGELGGQSLADAARMAHASGTLGTSVGRRTSVASAQSVRTHMSFISGVGGGSAVGPGAGIASIAGSTLDRRGAGRGGLSVAGDPNPSSASSSSGPGASGITPPAAEDGVLTKSHSSSRGRPVTRVMSSGTDGVLRLWDYATGRCLRKLDGHKGSVTSLQWFLPGVAASGGSDGTVRVWNLAAGQAVYTVPINSVVTQLEWYNEWLCAGCKDGT